MFGDKHTHQSPGLAALALVWFRFHNHVARRVQKQHPDWRDEKIFRKARRKVIAILQVCLMMLSWIDLTQYSTEHISPPLNRHVTGWFPSVKAETH